MERYAHLKGALRMPRAPEAATLIFKAVCKLSTVRDAELLELQEHYEGDHATIVDKNFRKPPSWDPILWEQVKADLLHVNSTRTSLRTLKAGVYGGSQRRKLDGDGVFKQELNDLISSPDWQLMMKRLLCETALYGTAFLAASYERADREFKFRHPNPVTTHVLVDEMDPEIAIAVAEFDTQRNWVRIWTPTFYAVLARRQEAVEFLEYVDGEGKAVVKPFFPVLIAKSEDIPGSPYGLPLLRDTVRFNRCLAKSYFNVSFTATMKAEALMQITTGDGSDEVDTDLTQCGPFRALILPKGAAAQFLSNSADVGSLLEVISKLQDLESYILGLPTVQAERNLSAAGAEEAAAPRTAQIADMAITQSKTEISAIQLIALVAHFEVGAMITPAEARRRYVATVRLRPVSSESLQEKAQAYVLLVEAGLVSEEAAVEAFGYDLTYEEIKVQAAIARQRMEAKASAGVTRGADESAADVSAKRLEFLRKTIGDFISDGTVADVIANATSLKDLVGEAGLPVFEGYDEPFLPVQTDSGEMVSGEVLRDSEGDVVGGAVVARRGDAGDRTDGNNGNNGNNGEDGEDGEGEKVTGDVGEENGSAG